MGFFEDLGEFFFGTETKKKGSEAQEAGRAAAAAELEKAKAEAAKYRGALESSMGKDAAEMMVKGQQAAKGYAEEGGQSVASQAARQNLQAMKTGGINQGQAALMAGQRAGDAYTQAFQGLMGQGMNQYSQNVNQFAQQLGQNLGSQQAATGQLAGVGQQQIDQANQQAGQTWGTIGNIASAGTGLFGSPNQKVQQTPGQGTQR